MSRRSGGRHFGLDLGLLPEVEVLEDGALARRAVAGNRSSFLELFRRHEGLAWNVARATALSDEDALGAVVDAFVALGRGVDDEVPFRAWLAGAVREAALHRSRRRRPVHHSLIEPAPMRGEVDVVAAERRERQGSGAIDVAAGLATTTQPPPPELWALVQVAWDDQAGGRMVETS